MLPKDDFLVLYLYFVCSYKLITHDKRFNVIANIFQRIREFYTQRLILLTLSHLGDTGVPYPGDTSVP